MIQKYKFAVCICAVQMDSDEKVMHAVYGGRRYMEVVARTTGPVVWTGAWSRSTYGG